MNRKDKKELKKSLNDIYSNKIINDNLYQDALTIIKEFEQSSPFFYNFNMGKITFLINEFYQAKYYFEQALELDKENASLYYFLYKTDVRLNDFEEAFLDLFKYSQLCSRSCDVLFPLTLLEQLFDLKYNKEHFKSIDYEIPKTNYFGIVDINNKEVLNAYYKIIDLFNQKKYFELMNKVNELNYLVNKVNYNIEVETLKIIVEKLLSKVVECNVISDQELESIIKIALKNKKISNKGLLLKINKLVNVNLEKALILFKYVDREKNLLGYYYVKNKICEKQLYNSNTEKRKIMFDKYLKFGRLCISKKDWDNAYKFYSLANNYIKHPVINYYIGKVYFKKGDYVQALKYLLEYGKHGGEKYQKALFYLAIIYKKSNNMQKVNYYLSRMQYLENLFNMERKIDCQFLLEELVTEEDFNVDDKNLSIEYYYEYNFKNKILFIRKMFLEGKNKVAEKLLKELVPNDQEDKNMLNELVKDKQLLKRKAKFGN